MVISSKESIKEFGVESTFYIFMAKNVFLNNPKLDLFTENEEPLSLSRAVSRFQVVRW